jgi:hypothetical protein
VRLPVEVRLIRRVAAVVQAAVVALRSRRACELAPDGASLRCVPTRR